MNTLSETRIFVSYVFLPLSETVGIPELFIYMGISRGIIPY